MGFEIPPPDAQVTLGTGKPDASHVSVLELCTFKTSRSFGTVSHSGGAATFNKEL